MKFQIVSDLHLDVDKFELPETDADAILIAGDLANGRGSLNWLYNTYNKHQKPIYMVMGNHEYYNKFIETGINKFHTSLINLGLQERVHILDIRKNPWYLLDDNIVLIGDTLWTDFNNYDSVSRHISNYSMWDFKCIRKGDWQDHEPFLAEDAYMEHCATLNRFRELRETFWSQKLVVMTHHAPSRRSVAPAYVNSKELNGAFVSDLEDFIEEITPDLWIHGHTHNTFDYHIGKTRIICNPKGLVKYGEGKDFIPDLVVEVL